MFNCRQAENHVIETTVELKKAESDVNTVISMENQGLGECMELLIWGG